MTVQGIKLKFAHFLIPAFVVSSLSQAPTLLASFKDLPTDLKARILGEAAGEDLEQLKKFGEVSKSFNEAMKRALNTKRTHIDARHLTEENVATLKEVGDLDLQVTDGVTAEKLKLIGQLKRLRMLSLNNTQVSDLAPLQGLTNLIGLYLRDTQVSDLAPLQGLTNLKALELYNTQVSDLAPLQGSTNLKALDLNNTQVRDLAPLQGLTNLIGLYLSDTQVSDLAPLQGLTNLVDLDLRNTQVSNLAPLQGLTNLEKLFLGNTQVRDLAPLQGLTNLKELDLRNTQVSAEEIAQLQKHNPRINIKSEGNPPQ